MEFVAKSSSNSIKSDCLVVNITADKRFNDTAMIVDEETNGSLSRLINDGDIQLKAGKTHWLCAPKNANYKRVLVVCTGKKSTETDAKSIIAIAGAVSSALNSKAIKHAQWTTDGLTVEDRDDHWVAEQIARQTVASQYRYSATKKLDKPLPQLKKLTLSCRDSTQAHTYKKALECGRCTGEGINLARHLGDLPGNVCTPSFLAEQAKKLSSGNDKLKVSILDEKKMERLGMHSLLSVTSGTVEPAKLIVMEYKGKASKAPIALVGKGITFDSGGISLKPGAAMDEMKYDMCGAASVFGTVKTLTELNAPVHVVAVIAAVENMPSGTATRPGDVVKSMSGQTIEILNTDAEGRLILCDALTYVERFKPKYVIDIATLTGACIVALGSHISGMYANNQALADELLAAGKYANDEVWQMPLGGDYDKQLKSNFADLANIGGREAGSVTAACFLSHFTKKYQWAHLDVAGTAWRSGASKGATGRPVSLLVQMLLKGNPAKGPSSK